MGGTTYGAVDDDDSIATIHAAIASGINLIDTAPAYGDGRAETVIGKAIKGRRDSVILASQAGEAKTPDRPHKLLRPEMIRTELENSLRHLDVEYIDLYQIHWPDPTTPLEDTIEVLLKLQEEGKFRYLGVSNFNPNQIDQVLKLTNIVSLQPEYSLLNRDIETEILPYCLEHNIGVLAYGPIASGILAGKYRETPDLPDNDTRHHFYPYFEEPIWSKAMQLLEVLENVATKYSRPVAHVAINWMIQKTSVTSAIVGARRPEQAKSNAVAGTWQIADADLQVIEHAYKKIFA